MLEKRLLKFQKLRVDRASKTPAPHKPSLLLAILDLVESGEITTPQVKLAVLDHAIRIKLLADVEPWTINAGGNGLAVISGKPGFGKSQLAKAFC